MRTSKGWRTIPLVEKVIPFLKIPDKPNSVACEEAHQSIHSPIHEIKTKHKMQAAAATTALPSSIIILKQAVVALNFQ